jgi:hypothetical protein
MESVGLTIFKAVGYGLGITALAFTAFIMIVQPIVIVEQNLAIRYIELAGIGVAIASLLRQLLVVKR